MRRTTAALALLFFGSLSARADIILSTDFDGLTVSGSTASNITWVTNGVADPGDLEAIDSNPDGLFTTTDAEGRFAPDRNLHNEGDWSVDILLSLLGSDIALGTVSLDAFIFNNDGDLQTVNRNLSLSLTLFNDTMTQLQPPVSVNDIYPNNQSSAIQPQPVSFDLSGNVLSANTDYTLRLTATGDGPGNNAGVDNLEVNGDFIVSEIPEPAPLSIMAVGALAMLLGLRQRRRQA